MKKISIAFLVFIIYTPVFAYDYGNSYNNSYDSGYESTYGNQYQYDMSNPVDRNSYSIDLDAQRRDSMSLNPSRDIDRGMGQYGGGIYDN